MSLSGSLRGAINPVWDRDCLLDAAADAVGITSCEVAECDNDIAVPTLTDLIADIQINMHMTVLLQKPT
ncbi:hypothetical protein FE257_003852 [Aspergillus nanangensis]|uniref:Uncharacterized protein n=1 Tax=Aspergillus nanangensis TaxID=2582783 RepID=A0AAD4GNB0_ASPNN|nr:hypothetical protein FE257_003852 [Aspergillus nanangensis]